MCIAAPFFDSSGAVLAAIGVTVIAEKSVGKARCEATTAVVEAADAVSPRLGNPSNNGTRKIGKGVMGQHLTTLETGVSRAVFSPEDGMRLSSLVLGGRELVVKEALLTMGFARRGRCRFAEETSVRCAE